MPSPEANREVQVRAFTPRLRAAAVLLQALALGSLLELAARVALDLWAPGDVERAPLPLLVQRAFFFTVLPLLLVYVLNLLCAATLKLRGDRVVLTTLRETVEAPLASISAVDPLWPPLPAPGVHVRLGSGRTLGIFTTPDPAALVALLSAAAPPLAGPLADARARRRTSLLRNPWLQLVLVPALVALVLFRLHERITYGGFFGELYALGLRSFLHTLTGVVLYVLVHLAVLWACLRTAAGAISWTAARLVPAAAGRVRLFAETAAALAYDGGIAAVLLLRLVLQ